MKEEDKTVDSDERKKHKKALIIILACLLMAGAAFAATSFVLRVSPLDLPAYFADTMGITSNNEDTSAQVEQYTTFQSVSKSDAHWKAGQTTQQIVLANPEGNPVDMAPHIYVDFDGNGDFSDDECVYNPITKNSTGTVESYGLFIRPGQQIDTIELTRDVPVGTYAARVTYTAVTTDSHELANPMSFDFTLEVK